MNRQSRGVCREVFNGAVNKIPGVYNEHCVVEIEPVGPADDVSDALVTNYDYFNLTAAMRT